MSNILQDIFKDNYERNLLYLIHSNNQNIVYLETPFYLKDGHGATSVLQSNILNEKNALYIITCIKKVITKKFAYNDKATKIALKNTYIELPVTNTGKIDYSFMEERIRELSAYLSISGLDSYELNSSEKDTIKQFQNNKVKYKVYKLGEGNERLFDISSPQKRFNARPAYQ